MAYYTYPNYPVYTMSTMPGAYPPGMPGPQQPPVPQYTYVPGGPSFMSPRVPAPGNPTSPILHQAAGGFAPQQGVPTGWVAGKGYTTALPASTAPADSNGQPPTPQHSSGSNGPNWTGPPTDRNGQAGSSAHDGYRIHAGVGYYSFPTAPAVSAGVGIIPQTSSGSIGPVWYGPPTDGQGRPIPGSPVEYGLRAGVGFTTTPASPK